MKTQKSNFDLTTKLFTNFDENFDPKKKCEQIFIVKLDIFYPKIEI